MIILGLDPGLASTGFGAIFCGRNSVTLRGAGHIATSPADPIAKRLFQLFEDINHLMTTVCPELLAIENVFSLVRYPKAGIVLGEVLGIIYLSAHQHQAADSGNHTERGKKRARRQWKRHEEPDQIDHQANSWHRGAFLPPRSRRPCSGIDSLLQKGLR